jgi:hypothetical protein
MLTLWEWERLSSTHSRSWPGWRRQQTCQPQHKDRNTKSKAPEILFLTIESTHECVNGVSVGAGIAADPEHKYAGIHSRCVGATSDVNPWGLQ